MKYIVIYEAADESGQDASYPLRDYVYVEGKKNGFKTKEIEAIAAGIAKTEEVAEENITISAIYSLT